MMLDWLIAGAFLVFVGAFALGLLTIGVLVGADLLRTTFDRPLTEFVGPVLFGGSILVTLLVGAIVGEAMLASVPETLPETWLG